MKQATTLLMRHSPYINDYCHILEDHSPGEILLIPDHYLTFVYALITQNTSSQEKKLQDCSDTKYDIIMKGIRAIQNVMVNLVFCIQLTQVGTE